jgi:hypothetical protein
VVRLPAATNEITQELDPLEQAGAL